MRSRHADDFNHDPWAARYDAGVKNEANPIRAGYAELLRWTVDRAAITPASVVMDLGSGTGNSAALIESAEKVVCVDLSPKMTAQATAKLVHLPDVEYVEADLLEVFDLDLPLFDAIFSTYSVHHLTEDEKPLLFERVFDVLRPGGRAVFGDLMFESAAARDALATLWNDQERAQVLKSLDEEFPWLLDRARENLEAVGFSILEVKRFSTLSWGVAAVRP